MTGEGTRSQEYERQRTERRRLRELEQKLLTENETAIREVLDEFHPDGISGGLLERICRVQGRLVKEIVLNEKIIREMHDGIHLVAEGAAQRWIEGFDECAQQIRRHGEELGLSSGVVDGLLRNQVSRQETEKTEKDRAATQQVEWTRG